MGQRLRVGLLAALVGILLAAAPGSARAAQATCPDTFEVLHDDTVGALYLVKGHYVITLLDASALSCAEASDLFRQFLEDWDGKLQRPWRVDAQASSFTRGAGGTVGFKVTRTTSGGGGGGGGHHPVGTACPGTFRVLHDDYIGSFRVPAGVYRITLLAVGRLTCARASAYLSRFLLDFDGVLPSPWYLDPETASFVRGSRNVGFRIKELAGPPNPNASGSGVHPLGGRCRGTFRVDHNDRIGRLRLPAGPYVITRYNGLSCARASSLFSHFLDDFTGALPRPWRLNVQTGTFSRGSGSAKGFRVEPARS
jgi:hypothetical protein